MRTTPGTLHWLMAWESNARICARERTGFMTRTLAFSERIVP
jgi:hypothetical protein